MKLRYLVAFLLVAACYVASRWAGWYDFNDVRVQPRSFSRNVAPERVEAVVGEEPYPQPAADGAEGGGFSWLTGLQPVEVPNQKRLTKPELSLLWKVACGPGHAAPVVVGEWALLITGGEQGVELQAYQLQDGKAAWKQTLCATAVRPLHPKGAATTSTPVVAGDRVIVCWSDMQQEWMASFDREGNELWRTRVGATNAQWGFNSSPVHYRGLVYINVDNQDAGFASAFDAASGKLVWRQLRPDGVEGSYSSPLVIADATGEAIVVITGLKAVTALDAKSGNVQWTLPVVSDVSAATPVFRGSYLVASSGYQQHRLSVSKFTNGIFAVPAELWSRDKPSEVPYVPTPLLSEDKLFAMHDDGIGQCFELQSGKSLWKKRMGTAVTASPMWCGEQILVCGESGSMLLVDPDNGEITGRIPLSDPIFASPCIVADDRLLVRTQSSLQCFQLQVDEGL